MSFFSQFAGGPSKVTTYTSGSGNFTPISTNQSWARVTLVGGGGGGGGGRDAGSYGGGGGGSAATRIDWIKLNQASYAYSVGAGGNGGALTTAGNAGSKTTFGPLQAFGGGGGGLAANNANGAGGSAGITFFTYAETTNYSNSVAGPGFLNGAVGGNSIYRAGAQGFGVTTTYGLVTANTLPNTYGGIASPGTDLNAGGQAFRCGGAGADSVYGIGGNGSDTSNAGNASVPNAGTGYGSGGGGGGSSGNATGSAGAAGAGGLIIIEEFVQA